MRTDYSANLESHRNVSVLLYKNLQMLQIINFVMALKINLWRRKKNKTISNMQSWLQRL